MKICKRFIAMLLLLAMVMSMIGCDKEETTGTTTAPTTEPAPVAADLYAEARVALDEAKDLSLEVTVTTTTTVAGTALVENSSQTVTYRDIGGENAAIWMEEELTYGAATEEEDEQEPIVYTEIWSKDTVYAELDDTHRTSSAVTAEEAALRYVPVVLLDSALYGSITAAETEGGTLLTFTEATAGETWIVPEVATLTEATGTALLDDKGVLTEMSYTVTYTLGTTQTQTVVQSKPLAEAKEITIPEKPERYTPVEYSYALYLYGTAQQRMRQADSLTVNRSEQMIIAAGALYVTGSTTYNLEGTGEDTSMKIDQSMYMVELSSGEDYKTDLETLYQDGKITETPKGGVSSTHSAKVEDGVEPLWNTVDEVINYISPLYWQDAKVTYFGNLCLVEFALSDDYGNTMQNSLCANLFGDANALMSIATDYRNDELTGYISYDLYTGMPVAIGTTYQGTHTIEGQDCPLSQQNDLSIRVPSLGAYKEIYDENPETEEPENKPAPLLYKVTGTDGQQMWLMGTIHVGDTRTTYMPKEVYEAFSSSTALALECDTEAFDELLEEDEDLASDVSSMYFLSGDETLEDILTEEEFAYAMQLAKACGIYNANTIYMKPSTLSSLLESTYIELSYTFHPNYGVEEQLYIWAQEQDKKIIEVESSMFQLEMLTSWSDELQMYMLENTMYTTPQAYWESVAELYELWCAGDEAGLRKAISTKVDESTLTEEERANYTKYGHVIKEYNQKISFDRNEGMLDKAIEYLESGEVVFMAVGMAHVLDDTNGLVDGLREAGYTVEAITYEN